MDVEHLKTRVINVNRQQINKEYVSKLFDPLCPEITKPVFIKPNLAVPADPESGVVTDIKLISSLIDFLRSKGAEKISVGEGPVIGYDTQTVFSETGYAELAQDKDFELVDLNSASRKTVTWHYGEILIPEIVLESFYINVAKLKTHVQTTVSLTLKNQKGILLPKDKKNFHRNWGLNLPIAHLAEAVKPDLAIIDGMIGLEGDGPLSNGKPKKLGIIAASDNMVELDSICCHLVGINPHDVLHLKHAEKVGLGNIPANASMFQELQLPSSGFEMANEDFRKMGKLYSIRNPYACTGCGDSIACAIEKIKSNPKHWPRLASKLAFRALIGGLVILSGKNCPTKGLKGKRICIGECTRELASENGLVFVSGCPPKPEDIIPALLD